jgi:uncharacterized protein YndB with AHSA1/START domain
MSLDRVLPFVRRVAGRVDAVVDNSNPLSSLLHFKREHAEHYTTTDRSTHPRAWPAGFDPKTAPVYSHSELFVDAPPHQVFRLITNAKQWTSFYEDISDVHVKGDAKGDGRLRRGTEFSWRVFGTKQHSEVVEYEENRVLGWNARGLGDDAYHRWILVPEGRGTRLISEEIQQGPGPALLAKHLNPALTAMHRSWVDAMRIKLAS